MRNKMKKRFASICAAAMVAAGLVLASDEITLLVSMRVVDGYIDQTRTKTSYVSITNATPSISAGTVTLTTNAASLLSFGDLAVKGYAWFANVTVSNGNHVGLGVVDASTNYIEFARLKPGEYGAIRLGPNPVYAIAIGTNTTTTQLEKFCVDD
jgi:hypothetical protein